ncbi:MAG: DUF2723 domain-containing protein [Aggregatilineales bacterium]
MTKSLENRFNNTQTRTHLLVFLAGMLPLLILYLITLQTIPNGSSDYFMIDVGETQIVLNQWGSLHATGYPLYVMSGALMTNLMTAIGVAPATAPGLVSLFWGILALGVLYALSLRLSKNVLASIAITVLFGLTRTVWIHQVIAEIYTFGLLILLGLLALALWNNDGTGDDDPSDADPARIYLLALLGGIGVAHHRALAMTIPALVYATFPMWRGWWMHNRRKLLIVISVSLALGLLGFAQYLYMPLRAGAAWVYGDPSTLNGFLDQFLGREANRFIGTPETFDALIANFNLINRVIITDLTPLGVLAGITGLTIAISMKQYRRAGITLALSGLSAYVFHVFYYTDILSALILPITLSLAFGWLFLMDAVFTSNPLKNARRELVVVPLVFTVALGILLGTAHYSFIRDLTTDPTGLETIADVNRAPAGSTVMIAWGPRYFSAGFAQDVLGEFDDITLVDHNADFAGLVAEGATLITPEYTLYTQTQTWWEDRLGTPIYPQAVAPRLVALQTEFSTPETPPDGEGVQVIDESLTCTDDNTFLAVTWFTDRVPAYNWSVFVHLLDADGNVIAQGDQSAPVYGWRPLTTWQAGEAVQDVYILPRMTDGESIRFGLYEVTADGGFVNQIEQEIGACDG